MRKSLILASACLACGLVLGTGGGSADAAFLHGISSLNAASSLIETVGWRRRYWRNYGVWPTGPWPPAPPPPVAGAAVVDTDDGVVVVPVRPLSCGEYHYWNGSACVDARYNDPYLGPK
jgi:hypothetical protein